MGSLWGHLYEGIAFTIFGLWMLFNLLRDYVKARNKDNFVPRTSVVTNLFGRELPVELCLKVIFTICGILLELDGGRITFIDENGNFKSIKTLQHVSIYCLFLVHSVLDFLHYRNVLYIDGFVHLTASFAFMWYGIIFHFHTLHSDLLENIVHTMGMLWCFGAGLSALWEHRCEKKFIPGYCRCLAVLGLGTWYIHTPFLLFSTDKFPGNHPNPRWDRDDHNNYQFVATMFAFHLCSHVVLSVLIYAVLRCIVKPESVLSTTHFRRIPNGYSEVSNEISGLLSEDEL